MKLLLHNMLTSHVKGVKNGYPLKLLVSHICSSMSVIFIKARQVEVREVPFNGHFISRMLKKVNWWALKEAADLVCTWSRDAHITHF